MTDDQISDIAKRWAHELLMEIKEARGDGEDVVFAVECFAAFVLGSVVCPGHDREMIADVTDGIARALADFRIQTASYRVRH